MNPKSHHSTNDSGIHLAVGELKRSSDFLNRELTNSEKSQSMTMVAAGALVANIPIIVSINMYGPRYLFTAVGLFGAFATALIPAAMRLGFGWFLLARAMQVRNNQLQLPHKGTSRDDFQ